MKITYNIKKSPSLDRLADSWRYCRESGVTVLVTFEVVRPSHQTDQPDVAIKVTGEVDSLRHLYAGIVEVGMVIHNDNGPVHSRAEAHLDPNTMSGSLVITAH